MYEVHLTPKLFKPLANFDLSGVVFDQQVVFLTEEDIDVCQNMIQECARDFNEESKKKTSMPDLHFYEK